MGAAQDLPAGLLQRTFPREALLMETLAFAKKLATNCSPTAVSVLKRQAYILPHKTLEEAQAINDRIQDLSLREANPDHEEGFAAFLGKRAPRFKPFDATLPYVKLAHDLLVSKL